MKKVLTISLLFLVVSLHAQVKVSLRNGLSISNISGSKSFKDEDNLIHYLPEIGIDYSLGKFSVGGGVSYLTAGFVDKVDLTNEDGSSIEKEANNNVEFSYLSVPLFVSYKLLDTKTYIGINAGTALNFNTSSKILNEYFSYTSKINDSKSVVPNILLGAEIGYNISKKISLDLSYRYNYALTEFNNSSSFKGGKLYSNIILIGVNYKLK